MDRHHDTNKKAERHEIDKETGLNSIKVWAETAKLEVISMASPPPPEHGPDGL